MANRCLGPLRILEVIGPVTYLIELIPSMKRAQNVFHVSELEKYHKNENDDCLVPITIDSDCIQEFEVKSILAKRRKTTNFLFGTVRRGTIRVSNLVNVS